jgi:hypothetical protein
MGLQQRLHIHLLMPREPLLFKQLFHHCDRLWCLLLLQLLQQRLRSCCVSGRCPVSGAALCLSRCRSSHATPALLSITVDSCCWAGTQGWLLGRGQEQLPGAEEGVRCGRLVPGSTCCWQQGVACYCSLAGGGGTDANPWLVRRLSLLCLLRLSRLQWWLLLPNSMLLLPLLCLQTSLSFLQPLQQLGGHWRWRGNRRQL